MDETTALALTNQSQLVGGGGGVWGGVENLKVIYNENELGSDSRSLGHYVAI